jgi:aryl-alcohol dehydrogenase-like predicted oxidoreductase
MEFNKVGKSGVSLTSLTFGTALTLGTEVTSIRLARKLVETSWNLGIRSFDTSNNYGQGRAEALLGRLLRSYPRDEFVVSTKGGWPTGDSPYQQGLGRKSLNSALNASLKRLDFQYIDVYYAHRYDPSVAMEETVRTFNYMISEGKILHWATSEWPLSALIECHNVCDQLGLESPIIEQFNYSFAINKQDHNGVREFCQQAGIGMLGYSPLGQGILTGKYRLSVPPGSRIAKASQLQYDKTEKIFQQHKDAINFFLATCEEFEVEGSAVALQWVLRRGVLPVVGASTPEQLESNVNALEVLVPEELWIKLDNFPHGEP